MLWIGTGGGVATYQDGITRTITEEEGLSSDLVTVIMESRDGSMWVGTYNAGLNRVLDDEIIPFTVNDLDMGQVGNPFQSFPSFGMIKCHEERLPFGTNNF